MQFVKGYYFDIANRLILFCIDKMRKVLSLQINIHLKERPPYLVTNVNTFRYLLNVFNETHQLVTQC